jgi:hypothetical protein
MSNYNRIIRAAERAANAQTRLAAVIVRTSEVITTGFAKLVEIYQRAQGIPAIGTPWPSLSDDLSGVEYGERMREHWEF